MGTDLRDRITGHSGLIADGSFATSLYEKGFYINRSFEELSLTESQAVKDVVSSFKKAGAQLLHTNTFNAIYPKMVKYGLQDRLESILRESTRINKEVAGDDAFVLGCIGPLGVVVEPLGPTSIKEAKKYFTQNAEIFVQEDVDGISLVGFHDLNELRAGVEAIKLVSDVPLFVHIGIQESMKTSYGHTISEFVQFCEKYEVDVIGFSGEVGPSGMLTAIQQARPLTKKPISLLPNAGLPRYVNDQYIYLCNPDYMGKYAKRYIQAGANIVGGFSGVKDDHVKAIQNALKMTESMAVPASGTSYAVPESLVEVIDEPKKSVAIEGRSQLGKDLATGKKVVTVEIVPPKGGNCKKFFSHCQELQDGGVRYVNIPDGARAVARMSSLQLSAYVKSNFELEPIPHLTTRDRNLIGLQSDILGAYVNGVRNVLVVTGDPPKLGNCPGATAVYDVDAIGLTHILSRMNQGLDLGGSTFGDPLEILVGVALNPTTSNKSLEMKRYRYKEEAGANFTITQPIYSVETYKEFFNEMGESEIPIIMGIWPLVSLRNAEFLKNEVPGVVVPDWVINEMKKAKGDQDEALKRGVEIAMRTMDEAKDLVAGFQVSAPFNRVDVALRALEEVEK